jgi:NADPH2:quinone reductase
VTEVSRAVFVHQHGGPEVLRLEDRELPPPGPGEVRLRHRAIGLNFIDVYQRSGLYKVPLPFVAGNEAAGDVVAVGEGVTDFEVGDRVSYQNPVGAYAEERNIPAGRLVHVPDGIDYEVAAAVTLKGVTAYYLLHETWKVKPGDTVLVHAAAGGVGSLLVPWAKHLGATVIGTAGSQRKLEQAKALGADHVIDYTTEDFAKRVRELTGGRGVDVVYDGVGRATFEGSLDSLRPRGLLVSYGNASGPVTIPSLTVLSEKGSLYVTRPSTGTYMATTEQLRTAAAAVFDAVAKGVLEVKVNQRYALADAAEAHRALEARQTTGSTVLLP